MRSAGNARRAAFTLLEILAVVAIFALLAGLALPNFSGLHKRNLDNQADQIVAFLELARQRAIVTRIPHRVFIDIDGGTYHMEWLRTGADAADGGDEEEDSQPADPAGLASGLPLDLTPPKAEQVDYEPVPGRTGRAYELPDMVDFAGIETAGQWSDTGEVFVGFERDGSADATIIVLEHERGYEVSLEVLPLADRVRVTHEAL